MRIITEVASGQETVLITTCCTRTLNGDRDLDNTQLQNQDLFKALASLCSKYDLPMCSIPFPRIPSKSKEARCCCVCR